MIRFMLAILVATFTVASAAAQAPDRCASKAVGKDGRELHGAARTSFMAKCKREACAPKAVGSDGRADAKLSGQSVFLAADCAEGAQPVLRNESDPESESGLPEHQPLRSEQHLQPGPFRPAEDSRRDGRHRSLGRVLINRDCPAITG